MSDEHDSDIDKTRHSDRARGAFDSPHHPPLTDPETNPRGVRHLDETAQDQMPVLDRPRCQAAQARRSRMIAAATQVLKKAANRPEASRSGRDSSRAP